LFLADERGLIDLSPSLTEKGVMLIDGIEPSACSGWHVGGSEPVGDWRERPHRMSGWQPMATAPRDGTRILLKRKSKARRIRLVVIGHWSNNIGVFWSLEGMSKNAGAAQDSDLLGWMPLP
jgi:hypothetical protein